MHPYIKGITALFQQHANAARARSSKEYLRNQFNFFGIITPLRRQVDKDYMKNNLPAYSDLPVIVKQLWTLPEREYQYFGIELMIACRKNWKEDIIGLMEFSIVNKSWWDTVDFIVGDLTGPYFQLFPGSKKKITRSWNRSENIWLQRSSLLFQNKYKAGTDPGLLAAYIQHLSASKEFFIQKAIGWALREYSKTDPEWVKQFVAQNKLSPLSAREALKRIGGGIAGET
jgi:3-methyladenine DNA glycosylase AlkD